MSPRVAAIDVGSNTVLCLVAERALDGSLRRVVDRATITGLGRGAFGRGTLGDEALARTIAAVRAHASEARALGAEHVLGVGTSALRDASDRERFAALARETLDAFDVISGDEEARLTFEGAAAGLALEDAEHTVLDIGGGSTEIAIGREAARSRTSLQLGSVRLFERHLASDPPSSAELAALEADVERALDASGVGELPPLVALASTATTVACVVRAIPYEEVDRVHGLVLDREEISLASRELAARTSEERRCDRRIEPARADVLVAGAILFARVCARSASPRVRISDGGLRWALAERALSQRATRA
jgi:exopolyphosphatase/guanosine-5'-triphosphate,3'-diphosphate pyrophosphatase